MGGYAGDLFNIFYRMEPHAWCARASRSEGRPAGLPEQFGVLETIEKVEEGQRLFEGNEEHGPGSAEARSFADALRQVPDDHDGVSVA